MGRQRSSTQVFLEVPETDLTTKLGSNTRQGDGLFSSLVVGTRGVVGLARRSLSGQANILDHGPSIHRATHASICALHMGERRLRDLSFVPRPLRQRTPAVLKVPFYHENIDAD